MNQEQDNITTMFQTTVDYLDTQNALWSGTAAFVDAVTRAKAGIDAIDTSSDKQQTPTTGITGDKQTRRDDLEAKTLEIADQLSALAAKNGSANLGAQVEMSKSSLDKMDDSTLEQTAERVVGLANDNLTALADYNVVAADVAALNNARTDFAEVKTSPRMATGDRRAQTESLPVLIGNVRSIFRNEIDKMVTKKKSNVDFYNGYFAARVIVNRAATHKTTPATPTPPKP